MKQSSSTSGKRLSNYSKTLRNSRTCSPSSNLGGLKAIEARKFEITPTSGKMKNSKTMG